MRKRVYTLMQDKKLPVFCRYQSIPAVRASQLHGREAVILRSLELLVRANLENGTID